MRNVVWSRGVATLIAIALVASGGSAVAEAQGNPATEQDKGAHASSGTVPRLVQYSGRARDAAGMPLTGTTAMIFTIYAEEQGGPPLWTEVQNVELDSTGRYSVLLGSRSDGLPVELFATGEARWLGTQTAGYREESRTLLLSVPYALKAQDSETLGGRPATDYLLSSSAALQPVAPAAPTPSDKSLKGVGTPNFLSKFIAIDTLADSAVFESGGNVGIGTTTPGVRLDVAGNQAIAGTLRVTGGFTAGLGLVSAQNSSQSGIGFVGIAPAQNGMGMYGIALGQFGIGMRGNGSAYGVFGSAVDTSVTGGIGVIGTSSSTAGIGVFADSGSASGQTRGVQARISSPSGIAGLFEAPAGADLVVGRVAGVDKLRVDSTGGLFASTGRFATSTVSEALRSDSSYTSGYAILGNATGGSATGVFGWATGVSGYGVYGDSSASTGTGAGIYGKSGSASGTGGRFENSGGGDLLRGTVGTSTPFRVDNGGNVYATSFRDAGGVAIPNGDVTGVTAGTGLTGGGTSGDVTVALDTSFADGRYARLTGGNALVGNQNITGDVSSSGTVAALAGAFDGGIAAFGGPTKPNANGVRGETTSSTAAGVVGTNIAATGAGVRGNGATGVEGLGAGSSGRGVRGQGVIGVEGFGSIWGVTGSTNTAGARGVRGSYDGPGLGYGVEAETAASSGIALQAWSFNATGNTIGVRGMASSPNGIGGVFDNTVGGTILQGNVNGALKFKVDGTGSVFASSYRDLAGNPLPGGDITGVSVGTGLTGGGTAGEVSVGLDTTFTDGRYAALVHAHDVSQIANAATLGANSFTGTQNVSGNVSASGLISGATGSLDANNTSQVLLVNQAGEGSGIHAKMSATGNSTAIFGESLSAAGNTDGVRGRTNSPNGNGVFGESMPDSGGNSVAVRGLARGVNSVGLFGSASATTGGGIGVFAIAQSASGSAGVFDNGAAGTLLLGQVNGTHKFRVDGSGAVYANSYRDLAGNPIPTGTGDITAVTVGSGLTGGGTSGDVLLGLDTAFTDARYARLNSANSFTGNQTVGGNITATGSVFGAQVQGTTVVGAQGIFTTASAVNTDTVQVTQGVLGRSLSSSGTGVIGEATASTGSTVGVKGTASSPSGIAVFGDSPATTGFTRGVRGRTASPDGMGVHGEANSASGQNFGVFGQSLSPQGTGVRGVANSGSGFTFGVTAQVNSPQGIAGVFNANGGDILVGQTSGTQKFRVDGTGAVYSDSYRDLAGNPIPTATGDITAVAAGSGLTGGGTSGDLTVSLDTAFTNATYAAKIHSHVVGEVSGAATLGANSFSGNQTVSGTLAATGAITGSNFVASTASATAAVRADAFAANADGVYGRATGSSGTGVRGEGTSGIVGSGTAVGVFAISSGGNGVSGLATATSGTHWGTAGVAYSPAGIGAGGEAVSASGSTIGVSGTVHSSAGIAGVFDNKAGGDIIAGRVNGSNKFRVDGGGTVYATAFQPGGADFAESVDVSGPRDDYGPGDVLTIDTTLRRTMQKSSTAYSTMVSGIYSTKPGVLASPYALDDRLLDSEIPLAMVGIVPCKVSAENGAIRAGDLLVTSSTPGHAMKGTDRTRMLGAIVGKALESLKDGTGVILVLVTLQ